jgi:hypothetical protein
MHSPSPFQLALLLLIKSSYCEASEDNEDSEEAVHLNEISLQYLAAFLSREVIHLQLSRLTAKPTFKSQPNGK